MTSMTDIRPTMTPKPLGFFSEWYVQIVWPSGRKEQVHTFTSEAHARGWIESQSEEWIARALGPRR
jgi:hypothetical protein